MSRSAKNYGVWITGILLVAISVMGFFAGGLWLLMFFIDTSSDKAPLLFIFAVPTLVLSFFIFVFGRWVKRTGWMMVRGEPLPEPEPAIETDTQDS